MEHLRTLLYPLGLVSALFFTSRFFLQWLSSEKKKESKVTRSFWILSIVGNGILSIHAIIQSQFPLAVLQGLGAGIAWRNLDLMGKNPRSLKDFLPRIVALPLIIAALFLLQAWILHSFEWMRPPKMPWKEHQATSATFLWHLIGFGGMLLFSSRFWLQWWHAEKMKESKLGKPFWWMSLAGSILSLLYFIRLSDVVNIAGYGVGIIPYIRNLMLHKKPPLKIQKGTLFLFAGEQSGDHLGGPLAERLKKQGYSLWGVGGKKMIAAGLKPLLPMESFQVMGITDVLLALPRLLLLLRKIKKEILRNPPEALILIDYQDFNALISKSLRKSNYRGKIIHYVSPSVWAWRKKRVYGLAKRLDLLLTILPFEKECYAKTSLRVTYVGHPLSQTIENHLYDPSWKEKLGIPAGKKIIGIFPGSRRHEIEHNLSLQLNVAKEALKEDPTLFFVISCAREDLMPKISALLEKSHLQGALAPFSNSYDLMRESHVAIATSGTVTLELALHKTPTLVTYRLSYLNYLVGRYLFRIHLPHYSLPNIISGKEIFPEFVHRSLSTKEISTSLQKLMTHRQEVQKECEKVGHLLEHSDASLQAANAITSLLSN
jgi:lipid-A-disaccharide synthase